MPNPAPTGVFPCYQNQFKINTAGSGSDGANTIADCEEFSVSFDNGIEEWTPFESEGWKRRLMTAKSVTISVRGKRNLGDNGNDMVAAMFNKNGRNAEADFIWTFPNGATLLLSNAVISVTALGSGASTDVGPLEFEVMSNGKPTYTPAA